MRFSPPDTKKLLEIMKARRDVRGNRFVNTEIEEEKLELILEAGISAPSVGYSQPWKFVVIKDTKIKENILKNFKEAPINIAVLYEPQGKHVLGMTSMKKMGEYSVVCAIQNMWLMSRTLNIGLGWVSILDEQKVLKELKAKSNSQLIAYLCLGYVDKFYNESELKTLGWKDEKKLKDVVEYLSTSP